MILNHRTRIEEIRNATDKELRRAFYAKGILASNRVNALTRSELERASMAIASQLEQAWNVAEKVLVK